MRKCLAILLQGCHLCITLKDYWRLSSWTGLKKKCFSFKCTLRKKRSHTNTVATWYNFSGGVLSKSSSKCFTKLYMEVFGFYSCKINPPPPRCSIKNVAAIGIAFVVVGWALHRSVMTVLWIPASPDHGDPSGDSSVAVRLASSVDGSP